MAKLETQVSAASARFQGNAAAMGKRVAALQQKTARAALGGPESSRTRHTARGKLLPRERVEHLIDPGSPLLELSPLAADGMYDDEAPGAGVITAIGRVSGRECVIVCNDATVKGGAYFPITVKKHLRAQVLLHRHREIGAALDRRVMGEDQAFAPRDPADAGDHPGARHLTVIHAPGGEL